MTRSTSIKQELRFARNERGCWPVGDQDYPTLWLHFCISLPMSCFPFSPWTELTHQRQQLYGPSDLQQFDIYPPASRVSTGLDWISLITNKLFVLSRSFPWLPGLSHPVTWTDITLCKYNCWRNDRRDFPSPLNTNI